MLALPALRAGVNALPGENLTQAHAFEAVKTSSGEQALTICNACRYCEQYCPVFPAMETRVAFTRTDLAYLANLCHNCGECLYACPYAPPHEFDLNLPRTLAQLRRRSYEDYCWPAFLAAAFKGGVGPTLAAALVMIALLGFSTAIANPGALWRSHPAADFYAVVPHSVMVGLFGSVFALAVVALGVAVSRFARDVRRGAAPIGARALHRGVSDVFSLRHLQSGGIDCVSGEEQRRPWRRWAHHCTFYGFGLCGASTLVAAVYHSVFGWPAPYGLTSLPVLLGTAGGVGLVIGPAALLVLRRLRDPSLADPSQWRSDDAFTLVLFGSSVSGLALVWLRTTAAMAPLLVIHLGLVLTLFLTVPYGKFVHGFYRAVALMRYAADRPRGRGE